MKKKDSIVTDNEGKRIGYFIKKKEGFLWAENLSEFCFSANDLRALARELDQLNSEAT